MMWSKTHVLIWPLANELFKLCTFIFCGNIPPLLIEVFIWPQRNQRFAANIAEDCIIISNITSEFGFSLNTLKHMCTSCCCCFSPNHSKKENRSLIWVNSALHFHKCSCRYMFETLQMLSLIPRNTKEMIKQTQGHMHKTLCRWGFVDLKLEFLTAPLPQMRFSISDSFTNVSCKNHRTGQTGICWFLQPKSIPAHYVLTAVAPEAESSSCWAKYCQTLQSASF